jgi:hypothetical protein
MTKSTCPEIIFQGYMPSANTVGKIYAVGLFVGGQSICECPDCTYGRIRNGPDYCCKHIRAARVLLGRAG